jgi:hypothetical protein
VADLAGHSTSGVRKRDTHPIRGLVGIVLAVVRLAAGPGLLRGGGGGGLPCDRGGCELDMSWNLELPLR